VKEPINLMNMQTRTTYAYAKHNSEICLHPATPAYHSLMEETTNFTNMQTRTAHEYANRNSWIYAAATSVYHSL